MKEQTSFVSNRQGRKAFADFYRAGYGRSLLPIAPPLATIHPRSRLKPDKLGKVPGRWTSDGYFGLTKWQDYQASEADAHEWDHHVRVGSPPPSIGLKGSEFPAVDLDIDDPALARRFKSEVLELLGGAPARHRTEADGDALTARLALFYRSAAPLASWELKFQTPLGGTHMIEFKADKRQMVVEGPHPKGGCYVYPDGLDLVEWGADNLTQITAAQSAALRERVQAVLADLGCVIVSAAGRPAAWPIESQRKGVSAPSLADVRAALAAAPNADDIDRAEWVSVAHFVKGACLGLEEDGFEVFFTWSEELNPFDNIEALWAGLPKHPRTGWPELARWAERRSGGSFKADLAAYADNDNAGMDELREAAIEEMFATQVWVEHQERVFDVRDRKLRNKQQFSSHLAAIGAPSAKGKCAWDVFMMEPDAPTPLRATARRQSVSDMTYRPMAGLFVQVGPDRCVNTWRPAEGIPDIHVNDADVRPWLDHVDLIVPEPQIREQLLSWMASVVQRQDEKPNHGVAIGGKHGIGKSMLIEPLKMALGVQNVQEIMASQLDSTFSGWLSGSKLFVVEEMMNFQKREMMQRLKNYLAAPPHTLPVNPKYGKPFTIPNLLTGIFFTNHEDAIAIEPGERRFFVIWSDAQKQPPSYFADLAAWYAGGGAALAARWLLQRDISDYNMLGEAPFTQAREDMRKAARSKLDELIETAIEDRLWPLNADLVALDEIRAWASREDVNGPHGSPGGARVKKALLDAGGAPAHPKDRRPSLGDGPADLNDCPRLMCSKKQARLIAVRDAHRYVGMTNAELVAAFWQQRLAAWTEHKAEIGL